MPIEKLSIKNQQENEEKNCLGAFVDCACGTSKNILYIFIIKP